MFKRILSPLLAGRLQHQPAVAILGPRQVGKTTLARDSNRH
jgi:predicted AAA+ superfamily ATPase